MLSCIIGISNSNRIHSRRKIQFPLIQLSTILRFYDSKIQRFTASTILRFHDSTWVKQKPSKTSPKIRLKILEIIKRKMKKKLKEFLNNRTIASEKIPSYASLKPSNSMKNWKKICESNSQIIIK